MSIEIRKTRVGFGHEEYPRYGRPIQTTEPVQVRPSFRCGEISVQGNVFCGVRGRLANLFSAPMEHTIDSSADGEGRTYRYWKKSRGRDRRLEIRR